MTLSCSCLCFFHLSLFLGDDFVDGFLFFSFLSRSRARYLPLPLGTFCFRRFLEDLGPSLPKGHSPGLLLFRPHNVMCPLTRRATFGTPPPGWFVSRVSELLVFPRFDTSFLRSFWKIVHPISPFELISLSQADPASLFPFLPAEVFSFEENFRPFFQSHRVPSPRYFEVAQFWEHVLFFLLVAGFFQDLGLFCLS